jgi:pimeloyl-ACP methyl ester carboxylesterase
MPVAKVKGEFKIYYEESGAGSRSLIVLGVDDSFGAEVAGQAAGEGVRVIRYDPRGMGRTEARPPFTMAQHSADLAAVVRSLKVLRPALLASGDMAGIAVNYAVRHVREIRRLVLVTPELAPADETKLGKVGEKAVVVGEPDADRALKAIL